MEALNEGLKFDVALVDLSLPDVDGIELIREIKRKYPTKPVISFSAYNVPNNPADYVLEKPAFGEEILGAIEKALKTY